MTSALATVLGKVGTTLTTSPALVGVTVGGLVVGTVGSLTLGGRAALLDAPQPLPLFACPDGQTLIGSIQPGEEVLNRFGERLIESR